MEVNGIFIKQILIPNADTLIKVNSFLICKTAVTPNIFWKMESYWHKCYTRMGTQLRNVFRKFFIPRYLDVGSVYTLSEVAQMQHSFLLICVQHLWLEEKQWADDKTKKWVWQREV